MATSLAHLTTAIRQVLAYIVHPLLHASVDFAERSLRLQKVAMPVAEHRIASMNAMPFLLDLTGRHAMIYRSRLSIYLLVSGIQ